MRNHSPIRSFVIATVDLWDGALSWWKSTFMCANLASNDYQTWTMRPFWLKFGLKSGSFEMSRHQMDCSAISWKFTKLIKQPTYIYIYIYIFEELHLRYIKLTKYTNDFYHHMIWRSIMNIIIGAQLKILLQLS